MIMSIHEGNRQGCIRYNTVSALALALALTVALPYTPAGDAVQNKTEQTLNSLYGRYPLFYNTHQEKHEENVSFSLSLHLIVLFFFFTCLEDIASVIYSFGILSLFSLSLCIWYAKRSLLE
jgi:hypothetical protein